VADEITATQNVLQNRHDFARARAASPTRATADHTEFSNRNPHWRFQAADAASAAAPRKFSHRYAHARMWNIPACAPANAARIAIAPTI